MGVMTTGGATVAAESGDTTSDTTTHTHTHAWSRHVLVLMKSVYLFHLLHHILPSTLSAAVLVAAPYSFLASQL